jgi:hypothetical protein
MKYISLAITLSLSAQPAYAQFGGLLGPAINTATQATAAYQQAQAAAQQQAALLQALAAKMQADQANAMNAARVRLFVSKAKGAIDNDIDHLRLFDRVAQQYWDTCIPLLNDLYTTNPDASTSEMTDALAGPRQEYGNKANGFFTRAREMLSSIIDSVGMSPKMADKFWNKADTALGPLFGNNLDTPTWGMRLAIDSIIPRFAAKKQESKVRRKRKSIPQ